MIGRVIALVAAILALGACSVPRFPTGTTVVGDGELNRVEAPVVEPQTEFKAYFPNRYINEFTVNGELNRVEDTEDETP